VRTDYEIAQDKLIPDAERYANTMTESMDKEGENYRAEWSRLFHRKMNFLADKVIYGRKESQWA
jgi:hypothetical protein